MKRPRGRRVRRDGRWPRGSVGFDRAKRGHARNEKRRAYESVSSDRFVISPRISPFSRSSRIPYHSLYYKPRPRLRLPSPTIIPHQVSFDFRLIKSFSIFEHLVSRERLDSHPTFNSPSPNRGRDHVEEHEHEHEHDHECGPASRTANVIPVVRDHQDQRSMTPHLTPSRIRARAHPIKRRPRRLNAQQRVTKEEKSDTDKPVPNPKPEE